MTPCDLGAGGPCRGAAWINLMADDFSLDIWIIFESVFHPLAPNYGGLGKICPFHRPKRITLRQLLTFEVEIIDASQGLDTSSWHNGCLLKVRVLVSDAHLASSWYAQRTGFCGWHVRLTNLCACKTSQPLSKDWLFFRESVIGKTWYYQG